MILEFLDGSQMEVESIFGGPKLVQGVMRDTLRIEVNPESMTLEQLKSRFKNRQNCRTLYTYTEEEDDDGNISTIRNVVGEGYGIFVSVSDEERLVKYPPGWLRPEEVEEVYIATISQFTYQEYVEAYGVAPPEIPS